MSGPKPFSQACKNNRAPILSVLSRVFKSSSQVLEIGSGTGQHAVYFAEHLPHLRWQPSDRDENLAGIKMWAREYEGSNLAEPLELDVTNDTWAVQAVDAAFSANTAHIMSWECAKQMIVKVARLLPEGGVFALYGPFNYDGAYTSESNERFDEWLKSVHPEQGIRDFEAVNSCAQGEGLNLLEDNAMPANNRLLVWSKR